MSEKPQGPGGDGVDILSSIRELVAKDTQQLVEDRLMPAAVSEAAPEEAEPLILGLTERVHDMAEEEDAPIILSPPIGITENAEADEEAPLILGLEESASVEPLFLGDPIKEQDDQAPETETATAEVVKPELWTVADALEPTDDDSFTARDKFEDAAPAGLPEEAPLAEEALPEEEGLSGAAAPVEAPETAEPAEEELVEEEPDSEADLIAMRAMIAEIVREELDGELGDRISRNIKRLVRREVMHIMDSDGGDGGLTG